MDSYFTALRLLEADTEGNIQTGLVFWGNSVVNVTVTVILLASDILYRTITKNWKWSGVHYTIMGNVGQIELAWY